MQEKNNEAIRSEM